MARDINKAIIEGRAGRDNETRFTPNGKAVTNFSLATGGKYKDKQTGQEKVSDTVWHNIVYWGELSIRKGDRVHAEGQIQTRKYMGRDGAEKTVYEIKCFDAPYIVQDERRGQSELSRPATPPHTEITDEDVPF